MERKKSLADIHREMDAAVARINELDGGTEIDRECLLLIDLLLQLDAWAGEFGKVAEIKVPVKESYDKEPYQRTEDVFDTLGRITGHAYSKIDKL